MECFVAGRRGAISASDGVVLPLDCAANLLAGFPEGPDQMPDCRDGVACQHARTCVAHDGTDALAHFGAVAVHGAFAAGGLIRLERAARDALKGVGAQLLTLRAQATFWLVFGAAVEKYHLRDGLLFLQDVLGVDGVLAFWHSPIIPEQKERWADRLQVSPGCSPGDIEELPVILIP